MRKIKVAKNGKKAVAYVIGRFSPPHKGHISFFLWLLENFEEVIIGIGSCYEVGISKHPLLAVFREKMILWSLVDAGIDPTRISFVHLRDFANDWMGWWKNITSIPRIQEVTHFVSGNEKEILGEMKRRNIKIPFQIINPEKDMPIQYSFGYHATDLREAIRRNNYALFEKISASGTIALMGNVGGFATIREALLDSGTRFIPGRQTVDLIVTCRSKKELPVVLTGYRKKKKDNFFNWLATPGGEINEYESPMDAVVREGGKEETGLKIKIVNRYLEPAHVIVNGIMAEMRFVKLFSTEDKSIGGSEGGSSQVFHINLDVTPEVFRGKLKSKSDLERVAFRPVDEVLKKGLAYQQSEMLRTALGIKQ